MKIFIDDDGNVLPSKTVTIEGKSDSDSPGRGKKQCSSCKKYVGVRSAQCQFCSFVFSSEEKTVKEKEVVEITYFDGPGRGRKQCFSCKKFVGARVTKCPCGFDFSSKISRIGAEPEPVKVISETKRVESKPETPVPNGIKVLGGAANGDMIIAPAGKCPIDLRSIEDKDVHEWVEKIGDFFSTKKWALTDTAAKYYIRYFYSVFSKEYNQVVSVIDKMNMD